MLSNPIHSSTLTAEVNSHCDVYWFFVITSYVDIHLHLLKCGSGLRQSVMHWSFRGRSANCSTCLSLLVHKQTSFFSLSLFFFFLSPLFQIKLYLLTSQKCFWRVMFLEGKTYPFLLSTSVTRKEVENVWKIRKMSLEFNIWLLGCCALTQHWKLTQLSFEKLWTALLILQISPYYCSWEWT